MKSDASPRVPFLKAGHLPTLLSAFLYFDVSFMVWVLLGALGNHMAADLNLTPAQKGLMTAVPLLGGSILRLALGFLGDRIGPRRAALTGLMLTLIPLVGGWLWAQTLGEVYCVGLLLGVAGASFAVALPMASRWYPPGHQGLAMGIAGAGNSGTIIASLLAPRLAEAYGWHAVFGFAVIPILVVSGVVFFLAKDAPSSAKPADLSEYQVILKERDTYLFSLFYGVTFGGFVGFASFLPILLRDQYGIDKVTAGDLTTLCVLAGSGMRPLGGFLADKLGGIRMLLGLYAGVGALAFSMAQLPSLSRGVLLLFLFLACLGMGNGSVFQLVPQRFGKRVGIITGIVGAAGGLGGFFLPTGFGFLKQTTGSYADGFAVFGGAAAMALLALLAAQREWVGRWVAQGGLVHGAVTEIPIHETETA